MKNRVINMKAVFAQCGKRRKAGNEVSEIKEESIKTYTGDVEITESNQATWASTLQSVEKITGDVRVCGSAKLDAPVLTEGYRL